MTRDNCEERKRLNEAMINYAKENGIEVITKRVKIDTKRDKDVNEFLERLYIFYDQPRGNNFRVYRGVAQF